MVTIITRMVTIVDVGLESIGPLNVLEEIDDFCRGTENLTQEKLIFGVETSNEKRCSRK